MKSKAIFLISVIFVTLFLVSFISARSDCVPSSCVSPYDQSDGITGGGADGNLVNRDCHYTPAAYCGSYGGFSQVDSRTIAAPSRNTDYNTLAGIGLSTSNCYKLYSTTTTTVNNWWSATQITNTARMNFFGGLQTSSYNKPTPSGTTTSSTYTFGRGDGSIYLGVGVGKWNDNTGLIHASMTNIILRVYTSTAPWVTPGRLDSDKTCRNPRVDSNSIPGTVYDTTNAVCSISTSYTGNCDVRWYKNGGLYTTHSGGSCSSDTLTTGNYVAGDQLYCRVRANGNQGSTPGQTDFSSASNTVTVQATDVNPPVSSVAGTSNGVGYAYAGAIAGYDVVSTLSCVDPGSPSNGCDGNSPYYCIAASSGGCSPTTATSGARQVTISADGTNYLIFHSIDNTPLSESPNKEVIIKISRNPTTTINSPSPADNFHSTTLTGYIFNATGAIANDVDTLSNMTLNIYLPNGTLYYSNTKSAFGKTTDNNWVKNLDDYLDYKWNITTCTTPNNGQVKCVSSSTRTLITYEGDYTITAFGLDQTKYLTNTRAQAQLTFPINNGLVFCKFTVKDPLGSTLIANVNGTAYNSNINWNSSVFFTNLQGVYNASVTCEDRFASQVSQAGVFNVSYNAVINNGQTSFTLNTKTEINETNQQNITMYDDTQAQITYNIATAINNASYFTIRTNQPTLILNSSDTSLNPAQFTFIINATLLTPGGSYAGNITLTNSTYGLSYLVTFIYSVSGDTGNPEIYSTNGTKCDSLTTGACAFKLNITHQETASTSFVVNNTGNFNMSNCSAYISNSFLNAAWISFDATNFSLDINQTRTIGLSFHPVSGLDAPTGLYTGWFYVGCDDGDQFGNFIKTKTQDQPYMESNVDYIRYPIPNPNGNGTSGGGGGNFVTTPAGNVSWKITTENGASSYQISSSAGGQRTKKIIFTNLAPIIQDINIRCEGGALCQAMTFSKTNVVLSNTVDSTEEVTFNLLLNQNLSKGTYVVNIIGTDQDGLEGVLSVQVTIGNSGIFADFINKLTTSRKLFGLTVPYFALFLILFVFGFGLGYLMFYRLSTRDALALLFALVFSVLGVVVL